MTANPGPTVCLTFDFDAVSMWIGTLGLATPQYISRGEFAGEVGVPRVLDLLEREGLTATFFIPGADAELYPGLCRRIRDAGHEIGHHGYMHEPPTTLTEAQERRAIERGLEALDRIVGVRPVGYRSPAADLSPNSLRLLHEYGFRYDASLFGGDFEPYWVDTDETRSARLIEFPLGTINDMTYLEFAMIPPFVMPANSDVHALGQRWLDDFAFMTHETPAGVFTPVLHPQAIGRGSRIRLLGALVAAAKEAGAQFKTLSQAADAWQASADAEIR